MINFQFMPSRQLALYLVRLFLTRSAAVLVLLVMVLMMLDLLGESAKILAVPGNGEADLWHYVSLRVPLLVSRFLPFSVLLGALITFTGLNQHSEIISMKAAGLSAHQILTPMILASLGVAALLFAFNETVVVRSARVVNAWGDADYHRIPADSGILSNVWLRDGDNLIHVGLVSGKGPKTVLQGVTIYDRQGTGISEIVDAKQAVIQGNGWQLQQVRRFNTDSHITTIAPVAAALPGITPNEVKLAKVDPTEMNFFELRRAINEMEATGRPSEEARTGWWHKLSGPLSSMLMPLLAATAAFGLARSGTVLLRASVGMAMGFAYFVADNASMALGNYGTYPPVIAAWAPFLMFLMIGELVLIRQEE